VASYYLSRAFDYGASRLRFRMTVPITMTWGGYD
jgi:hypothetical protein